MDFDSYSLSARTAQPPLEKPVSSRRPQQNGLPANVKAGPSRPQRSAKRNSPVMQQPARRPMPSKTPTARLADTFTRDRPSSSLSFASISSEDDPHDFMDDYNDADQQSPVEELQEQVPKAMNNVLAAFADAGQRNRNKSVDHNIPRHAQSNSMSFNRQRREPEPMANLDSPAPPKSRTRRGGVGEQGESSRMKTLTANYPSTPAFKEIERVLMHIEQEWPMLLPPEEDDQTAPLGQHKTDFNPVPLALSLLDPASIDVSAARLQSFLRLKDDLGRALKSHIQLHYGAFDASVSAFNSTLANMGSAQKEVINLRKSLGEIKNVLGAKRSELAALVARRDELSEMSKILDAVEQLKDVPDTLETLLSEKRFLSASVLLVKSLKKIKKPELAEIGALADLKAYLQSQELSLYDIIIEELHNHLYLKSFYSGPLQDDQTFRTRDTSGTQSRLQFYLHDLAMKPTFDPLVAGETVEEGQLESYVLSHLATSISAEGLAASLSKQPGQGSARVNTELDSFQYIESLFEALGCLGKLGDAFDLIGQRVPTEIFNIVEQTVEEVEERTAQDPSSAGLNRVLPTKNTTTLTSRTLPKTETLRDLFWTLYSKLDAIMQGFRVAYEVTMRIGERRSFHNRSNQSTASLIFSLVEVWKPIQGEVKALLLEYLTEDEEGMITSRHPVASINEVMRAGRIQRDHNKSLFKFGDTDAKATSRTVRAHEEELARSMKASMPGLANTNASEGVTAMNIQLASEEKLSISAGPTRGAHRLLASPDPFYVPILFIPTLAFLQQAQETLPNGVVGDDERGSAAFLDDFVSTTYLPMMQDKVTIECDTYIGASDAFMEDPTWRNHAPFPIIKIALNFYHLVESLMNMLQNTPFHKTSYSRLIAQVIQRFLGRCTDRYKELISNENNQQGDDRQTPVLSSANGIARCSRLAQNGKVIEVFRKITSNLPSDDPAAPSEELFEEMRLNLEAEAAQHTDEDDLIHNVKRLSGMALLCTSLEWFYPMIERLRSAALTAGSSPEMQQHSDLTPPATPIIPDTTSQFEALMSSFQNLSSLILLTLRCEMRLQLLYSINKLPTEATFVMSEVAADPDELVINLNARFVEVDDMLSRLLDGNSRNLILLGLPTLSDQLFVSLVRRINNMTPYGADKMCRNIVAVQQTLKNLGNKPLHVDLERSRKYYDLIRGGDPQAIVLFAQTVKPCPFSFDECKVILSFVCEVTRDGKNITSPAGLDNRRTYNELLVELMSHLEEYE